MSVVISRRSLLQTGLAVAAPRPSSPNILLILMDDLGYPSLGCTGNQHVPTPNLDRLASEGVRFTDAYVTPQCTPTRATILTGQYTARNRMWHVIPWYGYPYARMKEPPYRENLGRDAFTLAKGLRSAGYATACIGKWHLTRNEDGDYNALRPAASAHYGFDTVATPAKNAKEFSTGDKAVDRFTDESIAFIERQRGRPWFCYLAHHSIHRVVAAPEPLVAKYRAKGYPETGLNNATYLAAIEHFDTAIGRLLSALDRMKLRDRTMVVFLSDNGGIHRFYEPKPVVSVVGGPIRLNQGPSEFDNAPLRAGKGSAYEGGIRVPMVVRWPDVAKTGSLCRTPVHAVDLMPTFFAMAGAKAPADYGMDGVDLQPLLRGGRIASRALYQYMPFYDIRWLATPSAVIREGDWKLIESFGDRIEEQQAVAEYRIGHHLELYNLRTDLEESQNVASRMPQRAAAMRKKLHDWIRSCGSTIPEQNPRYDAARPLYETRNKGE